MVADKKVSYRLKGSHRALLEEKAEALRMSEHQYARFVLVQHLEDRGAQEVSSQLLRLRAEVGAVRSELARVRSN